MKRVITHSGHFQPDDVFAVATLSIVLNGEYELLRTRDSEVFKTGDYVVDVGDEYDPSRGRFDHHQKGGAGVSAEDIPLSSFGLVWREFGEKICSSKELAEKIEKMLVRAIDADDAGILPEVKNETPIYQFSDFIYSLVPSWQENKELYDLNFKKAVELAELALRREILKAQSVKAAEEAVELAYREAEDKRIIVLDNQYPASNVLAKYPEPLFVIKPGVQIDSWKVKAVTKTPDTLESKILFPEAWGAQRDEKFQEISGVSDALFCHKDRWVAAAHSKEGAIALAKLAVSA